LHLGIYSKAKEIIILESYITASQKDTYSISLMFELFLKGLAVGFAIAAPAYLR